MEMCRRPTLPERIVLPSQDRGSWRLPRVRADHLRATPRVPLKSRGDERRPMQATAHWPAQPPRRRPTRHLARLHRDRVGGFSSCDSCGRLGRLLARKCADPRPNRSKDLKLLACARCLDSNTPSFLRSWLRNCTSGLSTGGTSGTPVPRKHAVFSSSARELRKLTIQPKEMPKRCDHGRVLSEAVRIELFAKSLILQGYDVLTRHSPV